MIKEITMYTVICDRCGKDAFAEDEYSGWNEIYYALECAENADYREIDGKHYCENCYELDEETDEYKVVELPAISRELVR